MLAIIEGIAIPRELLVFIGLLIGVALFVSSFPLRAIWRRFWRFLAVIASPNSSIVSVSEVSSADRHDTDREPPVGFTEFACVICDAAPSASAEVKIDYLTRGLTEAQTLRAEVDRLSDLATTDTKPETTKPATRRTTVKQTKGGKA